MRSTLPRRIPTPGEPRPEPRPLASRPRAPGAPGHGRRYGRRARHWPGLAASTTRRWELLASSETFEAWVIGWPPGGTIELHDHGDSAGAVVVASGELVETLVTENVDGSLTTTGRRRAAGTSWTMGRRHIHDVVNDSSHPAVSVHVYAPRLTAMTHYRIVDGLLRAEKTVHYRLGAVVP
jgi:hypothetical protein